MRVAALHLQPFDEERFNDQVLEIADSNSAGLAESFRAFWEHAWIVVIEWDEGFEPQFDLFAHLPDGENAGPQPAWMEQELEIAGPRRKAAFFTHFVSLKRPLTYGDTELPLPEPTDAPQWLIDMLDYRAPQEEPGA